MKFQKNIEKWKRSFRKRFSNRNPAFYYKKKLIDKKNPLIFDVGAHIGNTAMEYLKDFPLAEIHCFEPHATSFNIMRDRLSENANLKFHNLAFSNKNETRSLNCNKSSDTNSFLKFSDDANQLWGSDDLFVSCLQNEVQCSTLDHFCFENKIERIDVLKLDCQGFEKHILEGSNQMLALQKINLIFTEVSFREIYENQTQFHEISSFLEENNFELFNFYDNIVKSAQLIQADALFINKDFKKNVPSLANFL